jgi:membrane protease YdiL (CAAX protease family)
MFAPNPQPPSCESLSIDGAGLRVKPGTLGKEREFAVTQQTGSAEPAGAPTRTTPGVPPFGGPFRVFFDDDGLRPIWGILLFLALREILIYCVYPLVETMVRLPTSPVGVIRPRFMIAIEGAGLFCVAAATWIMAKVERRPNSSYGLSSTHRVGNLCTGLCWGFVLLSLLVLSLHATGLLVFDGRQLFGRAAIRYGAIWLAAFLLVGLLEEYLFRGYLQFTLARGIGEVYAWFQAASSPSSRSRAFGFWTAACILSLSFSLIHTQNTGESIVGLVAAGLIGLVFCLSLWRTGSLWWAIGFHTAWDWAQSYFYGVADSGSVAEGHLFVTHPVGRPIFSGGTTGPEGSILILPVVVLAVIIILFTLPRWHQPCDRPPSK